MPDRERCQGFNDCGDYPARDLPWVDSELHTARGAAARWPRTTELGSPYIKYKEPLSHFGCISTTSEP